MGNQISDQQLAAYLNIAKMASAHLPDGGWLHVAQMARSLITDEKPRPHSEWHEDIGDVVWWRFPIKEAPWIGSPTDFGHTVELHTQDGLEPRVAARCNIGGWPGYHTHFTSLPPIPRNPQDA